MEESVEDRESSFKIHLALHELEEPYREVFELRVFGELSFRDIGTIFKKLFGARSFISVYFGFYRFPIFPFNIDSLIPFYPQSLHKAIFPFPGQGRKYLQFTAAILYQHICDSSCSSEVSINLERRVCIP